MDKTLLGAIGMAAVVAGLLFTRLWRTSGERFFLFFAAAFALEGLARFLIAIFGGASEDKPLFYLIRLAAYSLIIGAIVDRNRPARKR